MANKHSEPQGMPFAEVPLLPWDEPYAKIAKAVPLSLIG